MFSQSPYEQPASLTMPLNGLRTLWTGFECQDDCQVGSLPITLFGAWGHMHNIAVSIILFYKPCEIIELTDKYLKCVWVHNESI